MLIEKFGGFNVNDILVSVIIPFYSKEDWLHSAVDSVLKQTYKNTEIIIVDDGSLENKDNHIKFIDSRVKLYRKENGGPSSARNYGMTIAQGKYIAFLDSDDMWVDSKLEMQIADMEKHEYKWSQHSYKMFWDNSNKEKLVDTSRYSGEVFQKLFLSFKCQTSTFIFQRQFIEDANLTFPINKRYGQDIYFFMQASKYAQLGYTEGILSYFRIRGQNAGFKPSVQLNFRSQLYSEIKDDKSLINKLPKKLLKAYKVSYRMNKYFRIIVGENTNNKYLEGLAGVFYLIPYLMFKFVSITEKV